MNRETVIAIILGIVLGGVVGFVVLWKSPRMEKTKVIPVNQNQAQKVVAKAVRPAIEVALTVSEPADRIVLTEETIALKGKAPAKSLIIVQSAAGREVIKTERDTFSLDFPLALGENNIYISAYSGSGSPQSAVLHVYRIEE